jgi:phosphoglycolate phosphatase
MQPPILVFDLDGTLVDTAADLIDSINHSLVTGGLAAQEFAAMRMHAGRGGRFLLEHAFALQRHTPGDGVLDSLFAAFISHYDASIPGRSALYAGVAEALDRFGTAGYRLAICTNKPAAMSAKLVGALGLAPLFAANCGADTFAFRKPDPRHLVETIAAAGGDPRRAIMIGDSINDITPAKAAGIPVIAVEHGYSDRPVRELEPSRVIAHFDELTLELVEELIAAMGR